MSFDDLEIHAYSEHSVVVQGDTRKYKEDLKKLGGKYNGRLKNGPGWIFPKSKEGDLQTFIKNGERLVSMEEAKAGELSSQQRAKEWAAQNESLTKKSPVHTGSSKASPTLSEYAVLLGVVKNMSEKINLLERAVLMLLDDEQKELLEKSSQKKVTPKKVIKRVTKKVESNSDIDIESSDDDTPPRKRLLKK